MSDKSNKTSTPGEWQERGGRPTLVVEASQPGKEVFIEVFVEDNDPDDEVSQFAGIRLTPEQARSVAAKLLELANSLEKS